MICRSSARETVPRIAMCTCGARRFLGLDGGEVLDVVAEDAAQVLDEPVEQRSEVQRIPRGPLVVVAVWVDGCAVLADLAVARAGERDEHRRAEHLAVRRSVGLADRMRANLPLRQVRGVLTAPSRPLTPGLRLSRVGFAPQPGPLDLLIKAARCARRGPALAPASAFWERPGRRAPAPRCSRRGSTGLTAGIRTGTLPSSSAVDCPARGHRLVRALPAVAAHAIGCADSGATHKGIRRLSSETEQTRSRFKVPDPGHPELAD